MEILRIYPEVTIAEVKIQNPIWAKTFSSTQDLINYLSNNRYGCDFDVVSVQRPADESSSLILVYRSSSEIY